MKQIRASDNSYSTTIRCNLSHSSSQSGNLVFCCFSSPQMTIKTPEMRLRGTIIVQLSVQNVFYLPSSFTDSIQSPCWPAAHPWVPFWSNFCLMQSHAPSCTPPSHSQHLHFSVLRLINELPFENVAIHLFQLRQSLWQGESFRGAPKLCATRDPRNLNPHIFDSLSLPTPHTHAHTHKPL